MLEEAISILEELEEKSRSSKNLSELEKLVIKYSQELSQNIYVKLAKEVESRIFLPRSML